MIVDSTWFWIFFWGSMCMAAYLGGYNSSQLIKEFRFRSRKKRVNKLADKLDEWTQRL